MKHKMIGAHASKPRSRNGLVPARPIQVGGGAHSREFIREVFMAADRIINRQVRPRP